MAKKTAAAASAPARNEVPYTVGTWHGYDNYQCGLCDFAHLDRGALERHAKTEHGGTVAAEPGE